MTGMQDMIDFLHRNNVTKAAWHEDGSLAMVELYPKQEQVFAAEEKLEPKPTNDEILLNPYVGI